MKQDFKSNQFSDVNGNPAGGQTFGPGVCVAWQNGPLAVDGERKEPNGCFVETIIAIAIDRLNFYEQSKFASDYNKSALHHLHLAMAALEQRTKDREARGVEGTHKV
jgi:hypothetical protein